MKQCITCKEEKSLDGFNKNSSKKDGLQTTCKECDRLSSKFYYEKNREEHKKDIAVRNARYVGKLKELIYQYLLEHPCVDCGESDPIVLEFDHVRGEKEQSISKAVTRAWAWERVKTEIDKCEVRCANCHRRKTAKQFGWNGRNYEL